ncbi:MAG: dockerin type I domain-containing protein [Ruminococcus flavefaciens]|nr:dockerin type I domain-containing protein [Ruminococcus flavefaciens]MCM1229247.1 dockerin type I domain-containing protein [Ruminococcus flavefaciens]
MKKLSAILSAVVLTAGMTSALTSNADYVPSLYFVPHAETADDGTLVLNRADLADGETITVDVFIDDESKSCWSVDPKWKCASEYITLDNVIDPQVPYIPYAYAEIKNGELGRIRHVTACGQDRELNTMFFTCDLGTLYTDGSPLTPYGENTSDYALTSFDMIISPDIPVGEYDVHFLTQPEDYADQRCTSVSVRTEEGSVTEIPNVTSLRIVVKGDALKGDVNGDGMITALDATEVLKAYSAFSTGGESTLDEEQTWCADVNSDGNVDSSDASKILAYYSYLSTAEGDIVGIEEFIANR